MIPTAPNIPVSERPSTSCVPTRCISVDVEEYFQIEAAQAAVKRDRWFQWPTRVEPCMDKLLALFDEMNCKATLFFLGYIAEMHPQLLRRCAKAGHEIATHGSWHQRLHRLDEKTFREDVSRSRKTIEDITGRPVLGYRAPTWSVTVQTAWAVDVLNDLGFIYDASIFPVHHPQYGVPEAPCEPFYVQSAPGGPMLLELPPLVWRTMGKHVPVAGGGYFRLLPLRLMLNGLRQAAAENRPAILYFHPWEFDPDMPRLPLSLTGRIRTYTGLRSSYDKLRRILAFGGSWCTIKQSLDECRAIADRSSNFTLQWRAA